MKSQMLFLQSVLTDVGTLCGVSTSNDLKTIATRVDFEGDEFLTITLPTFAKGLQKSLSLGKVDPSDFEGFSFSQGLPRFLGGFLDLIFDRGTGLLLPIPSNAAIFAVRQVSLLFSKVEAECTLYRQRRALRGYVESEQIVKECDRVRTGKQYFAFRRMSELLWHDVFRELEISLSFAEALPKHSGGATADRQFGNAKWSQGEWSMRLEDIFPYRDYARHSSFDQITDPEATDPVKDRPLVHYLEPGRERPVKVVLVPKTMKTPRVIAEEPTCMMFVQQGLLQLFSKVVDANDSARQLIGWDDQTPNQRLALRGSIEGSLATLDLKDASDRVSNRLVQEMLAPYPLLAGAVDACRSRKADVLGVGIIPLSKFASMGSALTFPLEAIVFMTIVMIGIQKESGNPLSSYDIKSLLGQVRTYGDDIIVPTRFASSVIDSLEAFGLKVNRDKSFVTGKFRESCGKEYYDGSDVSVVKVRSAFPASRSHVSELVTTVALRNNCYKAGLWGAVRFLDDLVERIIPFPAVSETSSLLGKISFLGMNYHGWDDGLQAPFVRGMQVVPKFPISKLDPQATLHKFFIDGFSRPDSHLDDPSSIGMDLIHGGRPVSVSIKYRRRSS